MGKHRAKVKKKIDALKDGLVPLSESKAGQLSGGFSSDEAEGSASGGEINGIISCGPINHNCPCGPTTSNSVAGCSTPQRRAENLCAADRYKSLTT